jgi:hypothetical protein
VATPDPAGAGGANFLFDVAARSRTDAWAVGEFESLGAVDETLAMHWDGSRWAQVSTPNPVGATFSYFTSVTFAPDGTAWSAGSYSTPSSSAPLLEHWDGSSWSLVTTAALPANGTLQDVYATSASDVWVVGSYTTSSGALQSLAAHWDGTTWTTLSSPNPGGAAGSALNVLAPVGDGRFWTVGDYDISTSAQTLALRWRGSSWYRPATPDPGGTSHGNYLLGASATSGPDAWAVGYYLNNKGLRRTLAMHWNGTSWRPVATPNPSVAGYYDDLVDVSATSATDAWADGVAVAQIPSRPYDRTMMLHWNGQAWSRVPTPNAGPAYSPNLLTALARSTGGDLWAVGYYENPSNNPQTVALHRC